jgi:hypothetical protein
MTETQERFLRAILERVGLVDVVQMHLFPSIRRGTVETGVAVLAVEERASAAPDAAVQVSDGVEQLGDETVIAEDSSTIRDDGVITGDDSVVTGDDAPVDDAAAESLGGEPASEDLAASTPRLRILTASYRHTIKGIDRGKWVVDVNDEAIAPLDAVEAVLRGVRHRSAEPADPELVSADVLADLHAVAPAA